MDVNSCYVTDTAIVTLSTSTPVSETDADQLKVFPNPARNELYISTLEPGVEFELLNSAGRIVKSREYVGSKEKVDLKGIVPGIYVLRIYANHSIIHRKIIIE